MQKSVEHITSNELISMCFVDLLMQSDIKAKWTA